MKTYRTHLHDISRYFDISRPLGKLSRHKINEMVVAMRESGLATNSISSYVRVTTTFSNWCRLEEYCDVDLEQHQVITRHSKNKKVQVIPLRRQAISRQK